MQGTPGSPLRQLQIVTLALIMGPVLMFAVGMFLRAMDMVPRDMEAASQIAIAVAIASPMAAAAVRARMSTPSAVHPPPEEAARAAVIVPFAILEAAAFLCAVAFLLTPTYWPLVASAIPLGTMLAWFPRSE